MPSETAARASVVKLASQKEQIQELLRDKKIYLVVDEAKVAKQKYINVLVTAYICSNLVNFHPLYSSGNVNSSVILHTEDDI